ncbi:DUF4136 domain-containing protein [Aliiglaciecola sp. LCG003]|uniref:DUF4136 domain-containing protein n=1 Tax=Aliiglaciecola sp. LCG003 TaxID=3053655 RepID=UPI002572D944|nr:DUF4136 domain-containing protein [Aliiglaciecola sp. LCG003]WJG07689.1 DUF4136 domain-containing protein [Aliiglaciecola sp. LCG003]
MRKNSIQCQILTIFIFAVLLLSACQSVPRIYILADQSAQISDYQSFAFHPSLALKEDEYETIATRYIKAAIITEMTNKGFVESDMPDVWVNFKVHVEDKIDVTYPATVSRYYMYRSGYGVWLDYPLIDERISQYTEGTLNIDIIDRQTNKLLWEGIAVGKVTHKSYQNLEFKVNQAVNLIFAQFATSTSQR